MTTFARNLILTVLMLGLASAALLIDGLDGQTRAGVAAGCIAFVSGLWLRSGKDGDGGPPSPVLPLACLALLAFACEPQAVGLINVVQRREEVRPFGGANTDYVRLTAQGSTPAACASPYGCLFYSSSSNLPVLMDASGNSYTAGTVWRARQVAGTPGGVATHDIWADTTSGSLMWRSSGGNVTIGNAGGWVTVDTSQTITGAKTFSAAASFTNAVTLGDAAADVLALKGVVRIDNTANTFYVALTHAVTANRAVTFPDAAGVIVLDGATQTLAAKTLTAPVINGATSASGNFDLSGSSGTTKTTTGAVTIGPGAVGVTGDVTLTTTKTLAAGANTLVSGDKLQAAQLAIASQATGDILYASSGTAWSRLAVGSTGQVLSVSGGVPAWVTPVYSIITGGCSGALGAATGYANAPGTSWSTTTETVLLVATRAGTVRNLYCDLGTAPGGADTVVLTLRKNAADQATTCTISAANTTCNDTSNTFAVAAGNRVSLKGVSSAGTASDLHCSFEVGN